MRRLTATLLLLALAGPASAAREKLALRYLPLPLPGAPSAVVAADVDGDGLRDDGSFGPGSVGLPLDMSFLTVEAGPPGLPVVAMTDDGLSVLRMKNGELSWETVLAERSVLAGTGTFLPNLGLVRDVDGDGKADVLFPTPEGAAVYLTGAAGLQSTPAARVRFPLDDLQRPDPAPAAAKNRRKESHPAGPPRPLPERRRPMRPIASAAVGLLLLGAAPPPLIPPAIGVKVVPVAGARRTDAVLPGHLIDTATQRGTDGRRRLVVLTTPDKPDVLVFSPLIDTFFGQGNGRFERPRRLKLNNLEARSWRYGEDVTGDGVADLLTLSETGLRVFAGTSDPRRDLLDRRPRQTVEIGGAKETVTVSFGAGNQGADMESSRTGLLGGPQLVDLDGDGRMEILLASPNAGGRGRVMVVRLGR